VKRDVPMRRRRLWLVVLLIGTIMGGCTPSAATQQPTARSKGVTARPPVATGMSAPGPTAERAPTLSSPSSASTGAVYYVGPGGDDSNPGTREAPWATPGYGSRRLRPGDTLIILGGRYTLSEYDADIVTPPSGNADQWVTIQGQEGTRPVLVGRDDLAMAINLSGASYVRVKNLEITHDDTAKGEAVYFRDGVYIIDSPASHIVLDNLYIHHLDEFGVDIRDIDGLQVSDCRIEYCGFGAMGGPEAEHGGWRNVGIYRSRLSYSGHYYQGGDGTNRPYDRPDGFGVEPSDGPIEIVDTIAEHNYGDGLDSKVRNTTILRCIVANNSCDGVKLWGGGSRLENTLIYGRGDGSAELTPWAAVVIGTEDANARFDLVNVTVDDTLGNNYIMHVQYDTPDIPVNLTLQNVIFRGVGPSSHVFVGEASHLIARHNLFWLPESEAVLEHGATLYTAASIGVLGPGNVYADPRLVAPACGSDGDYHPQPGSPAINAGLSEGAPPDDLDGLVRDLAPDIGAYEWNATQPAAAESRPSLTPVPTSLKPSPSPTTALAATPTRVSLPTHTAVPAAPAMTPTCTLPSPSGENPAPPASPIKLVFIHHSTGEGWLADDQGMLGITLRDNNYFVSDTNYGWGPDSIGDNTDIGHWWTWFRGPKCDTYLAALFNESGQNCPYSRLDADPGGENQIIMFKSCFPNSQLGGHSSDPATTGGNPLRGQDASSDYMTVANAKGIYNDILAYFATSQDKLFIVITPPPLVENSTDPEAAVNARDFCDWLVHDWLRDYPYRNVAVFDFHNVLTSNGGNENTNDLGSVAGNHHRWWAGGVQHVQTLANNYSAYGSDPYDSHPTAAGGQKASAEFVTLLNVFYHRWAGR
jgi:hypothetical protein